VERGRKPTCIENLFIHQANMVNNSKQYKLNQIKQLHCIAQTKTLKLTSNLDTRLAHNTLGKEKSKYSWQYFI